MTSVPDQAPVYLVVGEASTEELADPRLAKPKPVEEPAAPASPAHSATADF